LPLEQFEPVNLPLSLTVTPRQLEDCTHSGIVLQKGSGKLLKACYCALGTVFKPIIQEAHLLMTNHRSEALDQLVEGLTLPQFDGHKKCPIN